MKATRRPKTADDERRQQVADLYIELGQYLEKLGKVYKERATNYRRGELLIAYDNLPPDAGDHMRHPVQRAIDSCSMYDVTGVYERITAALRRIR